MLKSFKKFYVFLGSFFIFLIHFPFVFAKMKPHLQTISNSPQITADSLILSSETLAATGRPSLYDSLKLNTLGLSKKAFESAFKGFTHLCSMGKIVNDNILSIVDFSLPSSKKRLFVIDLKNFKVLYSTYVAHRRNSGKELAKEFSNDPESFKSSVGFYLTTGTYNANHAFSLRLEGEETGINYNAYTRPMSVKRAP